MLLAGAKQQVRKRLREAAIEETEEDIDPQLIILNDLESIAGMEFK